jgi:hypothetical protein
MHAADPRTERKLKHLERAAKSNMTLANRTLKLLTNLLSEKLVAAVFLNRPVGARLAAMLTQFLNLLAGHGSDLTAAIEEPEKLAFDRGELLQQLLGALALFDTTGDLSLVFEHMDFDCQTLSTAISDADYDGCTPLKDTMERILHSRRVYSTREHSKTRTFERRA